MEIVLWIGLSAIIGATAALMSKIELPALEIGAITFIVSLVFLAIFGPMVADTGTRVYKPEVGVVYKTSAPKEFAVGERILEFRPTNWVGVYRYKVDCGAIVGGCPEKWPEKFKLVETTNKLLVIVPVD